MQGWPARFGRAPRNLPAPPGWPPTVTRAATLRSAAPPVVLPTWGIRNSYDADRLGLYPRHLRELHRVFWDVLPDPAALHRLLRVGAVSRTATLHSAGLESYPVRTLAPTLVDLPVQVRDVPGALPLVYAVGRSRRVARMGRRATH